MARHHVKALRASVQLTVRGIPPELRERLNREAETRGWSLNQTVVHLLKQATGLERTADRRYTDLDDVLGQWSEQEADEFHRTLAELRRIDAELWQ